MLKRPLERLRKNNYSLWLTIKDLRSSPDPEALLSEWREAEEGSIGWRYARFYECALDVLSVAMDAPREEVA